MNDLNAQMTPSRKTVFQKVSPCLFCVFTHSEITMVVLFEMGQCIFGKKKWTVIISKEGGRNLQVGTQTKLEDSWSLEEKL